MGSPPEMLAQSPPGVPWASFDVASIKPQVWTGQGSVGVFSVRGNTLTVEHVDLHSLIESAYGLRTDDVQLSGGPAWARHGVLAESAPVSGYRQVGGRPASSLEQFRLMMQRLLTDRFQLKVHHAQKDLPLFNLVVAKHGPKLREGAADAKFSMAIKAGRPTRMTATSGPSIFTALPVLSNTGRPATAPFDTVVIDHAEKPSEN